MKPLTEKEYHEAPGLVQACYIAAMHKEPISPEIWTKAVELHPEYFPDETERFKIWAEIPDEVKAQYERDLAAYKVMLYDGKLKNKYQVALMKRNEPWKYEDYKKMVEDLAAKVTEKEFELFNKHFAKYGLKL